MNSTKVVVKIGNLEGEKNWHCKKLNFSIRFLKRKVIEKKLFAPPNKTKNLGTYGHN